MGLLLYAITTPPTADAEMALVRVDAHRVTAWAADLGDDAAPFTRKDVLAHHRVVTKVFEHVDACLPARFPTVFDDEAALRTELKRHTDDLIERLEAVRDAAEVAITAVWTSPEDAPPRIEPSSPGREYLLRRQAALSASARRQSEAEALAEQLEQAAGAPLRRAERHVCPSTEVALSLALLVERGAADQVKRELEQQAGPGVRILVHGPWPPYTFAERRDGGAQT